MRFRELELVLLVVAGVAVAGCGRQTAMVGSATGVIPPSATPARAESEPAKRGHTSAHGGALNAIGSCEIGHAEAKVEGDTLTVWFVGGAPSTGRAVPVPDHSLALRVTAPGGGKPQRLVLQPRPLELAGERVGGCSRFTARSPWLEQAKQWTATGTVRFKGQQRPLRIEYPGGYDPD